MNRWTPNVQAEPLVNLAQTKKTNPGRLSTRVCCFVHYLVDDDSATRFALGETILAVDRSISARLERNFALTFAIRAHRFVHLTRSTAESATATTTAPTSITKSHPFLLYTGASHAVVQRYGVASCSAKSPVPLHSLPYEPNAQTLLRADPHTVPVSFFNTRESGNALSRESSARLAPERVDPAQATGTSPLVW